MRPYWYWLPPFFKTGNSEVAEIKGSPPPPARFFNGNAAPVLFAVALIAAGQSSTVAGTLAGQIIMEGYLSLRISLCCAGSLHGWWPSFLRWWWSLFMAKKKWMRCWCWARWYWSLQLGFAIIPLIHFVSEKTRWDVLPSKHRLKLPPGHRCGTDLSQCKNAGEWSSACIWRQ